MNCMIRPLFLGHNPPLVRRSSVCHPGWLGILRRRHAASMSAIKPGPSFTQCARRAVRLSGQSDRLLGGRQLRPEGYSVAERRSLEVTNAKVSFLRRTWPICNHPRRHRHVRRRFKVYKPIDEADRIDDWLYLPETLCAFMLIVGHLGRDVARRGNGYGKEQIRRADRPFHGRGESWRNRASRAVCSRLRTPRESDRVSPHWPRITALAS